MALRQVPSRLEPELRGFLADVRNTLGDVVGGQWRVLLISDVKAAVSSGFVTAAEVTAAVNAAQETIKGDPFFQFLSEQVNLISAEASLPGSVAARLSDASDLLQAGIDANGSAIVTLQDTTATQATQITALGTRVGTAESDIVVLYSTTASQGSALTLLTSHVNDNTASIQTLQTVSNGLAAQYSVKLDVNGYVAGFGLYNAAGSSAFFVRADKFAIASPGVSPVVPFVVIGGVTYIDSAMIKDASIASAKIADAAITNAKIGQYIASGNFNGDVNAPGTTPGTAGFCINKNGDAAFNSVCVRTGTIDPRAVVNVAVFESSLPGNNTTAYNRHVYTAESGGVLTITLHAIFDCGDQTGSGVKGLDGYLNLNTTAYGDKTQYVKTPPKSVSSVTLVTAVSVPWPSGGGHTINVNIDVNWNDLGTLWGNVRYFVTVIEGKR